MEIIGSSGTKGHVKPENKLIRNISKFQTHFTINNCKPYIIP